MKELMRNLWQDESGQDLAEYAMLVVLIALVVMAVVNPFADAISEGFEDATDQLFTPS